ncbi:MAG TPA: DUF4157 domain-containing protein [Thermoanaerobaculia bacterium]|nr:DUF4157 domain-containing protein [Thermoanaerobaculia bacterium]
MRTRQRAPRPGIFPPASASERSFATSGDRTHQAAAEGARTPATGLPFADRVQQAFGRHDVSSIQAHVGAGASASAQAMGAAAYATGEHVVFGQSPSLRAAAHEAAHVVQQRSGIQPPSGVGQVGDAWERHAEAVANRVVAGRPAEDLLNQIAPNPAPARLQAPDSGAARPVQMINLGWVPANPAKWRNTTTKAGNGPATDGFADFGGKRFQVEINNIAKGGGAKPVVAAGKYPVSDTSGGALLTYAVSKTITPEADHIVQSKWGGANDYENARLLSKAENTNPATKRPQTPAAGGPVADTHLRLYTPINLEVKGGPPWYGLGKGVKAVLPTGGKLTLNQVEALCLWAGTWAPVAWKGFSTAHQKIIQKYPKGGGWKYAGKNAAGKKLFVKVS